MVQDEAILCRYCRSDLTARVPTPQLSPAQAPNAAQQTAPTTSKPRSKSPALVVLGWGLQVIGYLWAALCAPALVYYFNLGFLLGGTPIHRVQCAIFLVAALLGIAVARLGQYLKKRGHNGPPAADPARHNAVPDEVMVIMVTLGLVALVAFLLWKS